VASLFAELQSGSVFIDKLAADSRLPVRRRLQRLRMRAGCLDVVARDGCSAWIGALFDGSRPPLLSHKIL